MQREYFNLHLPVGDTVYSLRALDTGSIEIVDEAGVLFAVAALHDDGYSLIGGHGPAREICRINTLFELAQALCEQHPSFALSTEVQ